MAANPLFTGTNSQNQHTGIYGNNVLRQSNLNTGASPRDTSTPVRKKPRLGGTTPTNTMNESRNNSGASNTPTKLQEPPKKSFQPHKVQSNINLPSTSSAQQRTTANQYQTRSTATSSVGKPQWTSSVSTTGQSANGKPQLKQQQPTGRTNLTPPAGSVATRESPDLPTATQGGSASQRPNLHQQQLEKLRLEFEANQRQLKELKDERYSKDGEIKVLRQNLAKAKSEVSKLNVDKVQIEEKFKTHQGVNEKKLAKEVEQLRTQLEFKNVELREAQDSYRNLEQRHQAADGTSPFPASSQVTPPRRSLRVALGSSQQVKIEKSPRNGGGDIFPTQESFMENTPSATKKSPKVRGLSSGHRSSPRRMPTLSLASPAKVEEEPPLSQKFTPAPTVSSTPKRHKSESFTSGPLLCTRLQKGCIRGTQLLGKLMERPTKLHYSEDDSEAFGKGLLTLFNKDMSMSLGALATERASGKLSPTQTKSNKSPVRTTFQEDTNTENEDIAYRSLHSILNPSNISSDNDNTHTENNTNSLLGLLPLIEERLNQYLEALHSVTTGCDSLPSSTNPSMSTISTECSGETSPSSSPTGGEGSLVMANFETSAISCLQALCCMVCHSEDVCRTILSGSGVGGVMKEDTLDQSDISIVEIDPSAPLIDPTQAPMRQLASVSSPRSHCNKLQLLTKLIRLASLQQAHQAYNISVVEKTLEVLAALAGKAEIVELDRLKLLLINDNLSMNLLSDSSLLKACHTLDIMTSMCRSYDLFRRFCNQSDACQLLHVYQCSLRGIKDSLDSQMTYLTSKAIDLLVTIVNTHNSGASFLLETDCQCSMEVIEAVLLVLHREYRIYSQQNSELGFALLRQASVLLHSLITCTDQKLDIEYIQLIICLTRLFRKHPLTADAEAILLLDLWDNEDDEDEEHPQDDMEVDA